MATTATLAGSERVRTPWTEVWRKFRRQHVALAAGAFVVYIGTHGDRGAHRADVILPSGAYTEISGLYVNTEGRVQRSDRAAFPPGDAREGWAIFRALSEVLGKTLPYNSLSALRAALVAAHPHFDPAWV